MRFWCLFFVVVLAVSASSSFFLYFFLFLFFYCFKFSSRTRSPPANPGTILDRQSVGTRTRNDTYSCRHPAQRGTPQWDCTGNRNVSQSIRQSYNCFFIVTSVLDSRGWVDIKHQVTKIGRVSGAEQEHSLSKAQVKAQVKHGRA